MGLKSSLVPAETASTPAIRIDDNGVRRIKVSLGAMRSTLCAAPEILSLAYRFEVVRVDAPSVVAQVVHLQAVRDRSDEQGERDPVGKTGTVRRVKCTVSIGTNSRSPDPTFSLRIHAELDDEPLELGTAQLQSHLKFRV